MLVYVVDDDSYFGKSLADGLGARGIEAEVFSDAASCVVALSSKETAPDAVLVDLFMPVVDGFNLLSMIRAHPRGTNVGLLVVSGQPAAHNVQRARDLGADDFLAKPLDPAQVALRCESVVAARRRRLFPPLSRRRVAALFADLRGFTAFTAQHDPETVVEVLGSLLDLCAADVERAGGYVDKVVGDGLLALFGAPQEVREPVVSAVEAAMAIRSHTEAFIRNSVLLAGRATLVGIGAGIAFGEAVAGLMGPRGRKAYTAIGEPVNLAARLQGLAGPGRILLGPSAAAQLNGRIPLAAPRLEAIKGLGTVEVRELATS